MTITLSNQESKLIQIIVNFANYPQTFQSIISYFIWITNTYFDTLSVNDGLIL